MCLYESHPFLGKDLNKVLKSELKLCPVPYFVPYHCLKKNVDFCFVFVAFFFYVSKERTVILWVRSDTLDVERIFSPCLMKTGSQL